MRRRKKPKGSRFLTRAPLRNAILYVFPYATLAEAFISGDAQCTVLDAVVRDRSITMLGDSDSGLLTACTVATWAVAA